VTPSANWNFPSPSDFAAGAGLPSHHCPNPWAFPLARRRLVRREPAEREGDRRLLLRPGSARVSPGARAGSPSAAPGGPRGRPRRFAGPPSGTRRGTGRSSRSALDSARATSTKVACKHPRPSRARVSMRAPRSGVAAKGLLRAASISRSAAARFEAGPEAAAPRPGGRAGGSTPKRRPGREALHAPRPFPPLRRAARQAARPSPSPDQVRATGGSAAPRTENAQAERGKPAVVAH